MLLVVHQGGIDVSEGGILVRDSTSLPLQLQWLSAGTITGTVIDSKSKSVVGAVIYLIGELEEVKPLSKIVTGESGGRYEIPHIRPGRYWILGIESSELLDLDDPMVLDQIRQTGQEINVLSGLPTRVVVNAMFIP
jgi:hypothetical protein